MWSLIFFVYITGSSGIGITHIDNFISKKLCENAATKAVMHAKQLKIDTQIQYACILEIN